MNVLEDTVVTSERRLASPERPYIIRTYDRWIILVIVLVAGWLLFRPVFAYTVYYRGLSFERMIQFRTALHYYRKSQDIYPRIPEGWIGEGEIYEMWAPSDAAAYRNAIATFEKGLAYNPTDKVLPFDRGRTYFLGKNYPYALAALTRAYRNDPHNVFAWDYAAWASLRLGDRKLALRYWHEVLRRGGANEAVRKALREYGG